MILESMRMELPVEARMDGTVGERRGVTARAVNEGDLLIVLA